MKIDAKYAERLKRDREHMWQLVDAYKARIKYPLHPDAELRMRNDWLASQNVKDILGGQKNCESDIEEALNEYSVLFCKHTISFHEKPVTMIDVPVHDGTYKIVIPHKEVTQ